MGKVIVVHGKGCTCGSGECAAKVKAVKKKMAKHTAKRIAKANARATKDAKTAVKAKKAVKASKKAIHKANKKIRHAKKAKIAHKIGKKTKSVFKKILKRKAKESSDIKKAQNAARGVAAYLKIAARTKKNRKLIKVATDQDKALKVGIKSAQGHH